MQRQLESLLKLKWRICRWFSDFGQNWSRHGAKACAVSVWWTICEVDRNDHCAFSGKDIAKKMKKKCEWNACFEVESELFALPRHRSTGQVTIECHKLHVIINSWKSSSLKRHTPLSLAWVRVKRHHSNENGWMSDGKQFIINFFFPCSVHFFRPPVITTFRMYAITRRLRPIGRFLSENGKVFLKWAFSGDDKNSSITESCKHNFGFEANVSKVRPVRTVGWEGVLHLRSGPRKVTSLSYFSIILSNNNKSQPFVVRSFICDYCCRHW